MVETGYRAKRSGSGQVVVFEPAMELDRLARLEIERDLGRAFENQEFEVVYQPRVALRTGELVGVEALLRWRHPTILLLAHCRHPSSRPG